MTAALRGLKQQPCGSRGAPSWMPGFHQYEVAFGPSTRRQSVVYPPTQRRC
jgi:hypothetical protein